MDMDGMSSPLPTPTPALAPPRDLSYHFSRSGKNRSPNSIKSFYRFFQYPGIGNLAGGLPNAALFPFDTLEAQVARPHRWAPTPNDDNHGPASDPTASSHFTVPKTDAQPDPMKKIDLSTALQYGTADGYPPLRSFVRQFTRNNLHPYVPYAGGPEVILTCGSTDGFSKFVELFVDPWSPDLNPIEERPGLLCEVFIYNNGPATVAPKGAQVVPVEVDAEGMLVDGPGGLRDILENWDTSRGRRPHVMYTVTMGNNPGGGVLGVHRRSEIYDLCCEYDILIAEDEPYWFLQYPSAAEAQARSRGESVPPPSRPAHPPPYRPAGVSSGYDFIDSLAPSYLSLDTEGRVVRLDTFSKTIAPGCRLGWITAQPAVVERIMRITETSTQQPSGFVQSMVAELVMGQQSEAAKSSFLSLSPRERLTFEGWNTDGWVRWVSGLRGVYERRMNDMCTIFDEAAYQVKQSTPVGRSAGLDPEWGVITKTRLLSFEWPRGGMFIWIRVHFEDHPLWQAPGETIPVIDGPILSLAMLMHLIRKPYYVVAAPGAMFSPAPDVAAERGWQFFRLCFAAEDQDRIDKCSRGFAEGVQRFWRIKSVAEIEDLIGDFKTDTVANAMNDDNLVGNGLGC